MVRPEVDFLSGAGGGDDRDAILAGTHRTNIKGPHAPNINSQLSVYLMEAWQPFSLDANQYKSNILKQVIRMVTLQVGMFARGFGGPWLALECQIRVMIKHHLWIRHVARS